MLSTVCGPGCPEIPILLNLLRILTFLSQTDIYVLTHHCIVEDLCHPSNPQALEVALLPQGLSKLTSLVCKSHHYLGSKSVLEALEGEEDMLGPNTHHVFHTDRTII